MNELTIQQNIHNPAPQPSAIDWEQRRYEIAKTALPSVITECVGAEIDWQVATAVEYADALIRELQRKNDKDEDKCSEQSPDTSEEPSAAESPE